MRTIKFRGKDIENEQQWRYGSLITYPNGASVIVEFDNDGNELSYDVDADTVGQFTGMLDKNGKEIYEGDIVKAKYAMRAKVKYLDVHFCVDFNGYKALIGGEEYEVVDNIHDNPELLKGGIK